MKKPVQRIRLPEAHRATWLVLEDEFVPVQPILTYLRFLHSLDTIRASAHHLKLFWEYLRDEHINWTEVDVAQLAGFITWLRRQDPTMITLASLQAHVTEDLKQALGLHAHVLLVEPHHLPRSEGKVKRVVDRRHLTG